MQKETWYIGKRDLLTLASRLSEKILISTSTHTHTHTQELSEVRSAKESMRVAVERAAQDTRDQVEGVQADLHKRDLQLEDLRRKLNHIERELRQEVEGIHTHTRQTQTHACARARAHTHTHI